MIAYVSNSELGDSAARTSYSVPKPACSVDDLILMMVGAAERFRLNGATIKTTGDIATFTDLFDAGTFYSPPNAAHQFILDDGLIGSARLFWWAGWKIADASDAAGGNYTVNIDSGGGIGADRLKADVVCYSGADGIDQMGVQSFAVSGYAGATIICPGVTPTGQSPTGDFTMTMRHGAAAYQGGLTVALSPIVAPAWLICGAMEFYANDVIDPDSPLFVREQSIMASIVRDAGTWAERTGGSGMPGIYLDPSIVG